jgi:hypothetical protein
MLMIISTGAQAAWGAMFCIGYSAPSCCLRNFCLCVRGFAEQRPALDDKMPA